MLLLLLLLTGLPASFVGSAAVRGCLAGYLLRDCEVGLVNALRKTGRSLVPLVETGGGDFFCREGGGDPQQVTVHRNEAAHADKVCSRPRWCL